MTAAEFERDLREADYYDEVRDFAAERNVKLSELKEFSFQGVRNAESDAFNMERIRR